MKPNRLIKTPPSHIVKTRFHPVKVYISGPMTGLANYNYPIFYFAEGSLKIKGYEVFNPARNPKQDSWEAYMKNAIPQLVRCEKVFLLPGWGRSKGAVLEHGLAYSLGIEIIYPEDWCAELADPWRDNNAS